MPLNIPKSNPLTSTQSELTAKIGSMKSLLELPFLEFKNIPKLDQVSTFDYLLRILESMGISPEVIFQQFFSRVLDEAGTFLEETIVEGLATQVMYAGVQMPGGTFNLAESDPASRDAIAKGNASAINQKMDEAGLTNFLQTAKQKIVKDLTLAVFGPKEGPAAEYLNPNADERNRIIENAVCAVDAYSLSNNGFIRDEDVEYNRIALARQLEKGEVILEISCQKVKITLPEDPSWIFEGGGIQTLSSNPTTPAQSIEILATYVESTAQQINNQQNAKSGGKTFMQIFLEKFISNITNLVQPFIGPLLGSIQLDFPEDYNPSVDDLVTNTCEIMNESSPNPNKKAFGESLANQLYKLLVNMILIIAIREFKKLAKNYFARIYRERGKRKLDKIKARFALTAEAENTIEDAKKAVAYAKAAASLAPILAGQTPI